MVIDVREIVDCLVLVDLMEQMVNKYVTIVIQHVFMVACTQGQDGEAGADGADGASGQRVGDRDHVI